MSELFLKWAIVLCVAAMAGTFWLGIIHLCFDKKKVESEEWPEHFKVKPWDTVRLKTGHEYGTVAGYYGDKICVRWHSVVGGYDGGAAYFSSWHTEDELHVCGTERS